MYSYQEDYYGILPFYMMRLLVPAGFPHYIVCLHNCPSSISSSFIVNVRGPLRLVHKYLHILRMCIFIFEKKLLEFRIILALKAWLIKTDFSSLQTHYGEAENRRERWQWRMKDLRLPPVPSRQERRYHSKQR